MLSENEYRVSNSFVALCERGTASFDYDFNAIEMRRGDIIVVMPGHIINVHKVSEDYRVRYFVISEDFHNKAKSINFSLYLDGFGYSSYNPVFHLSGEQYAKVCDAFNMIQKVTAVGGKWKEIMQLYAFHIFIMMCHEFYPYKDDKEIQPATGMAARFQEAVIKHCRESTDVEFYADMFGCSAKHLAVLTKKELGMTPRKWIMRYLALQAKSMLLKRSDLHVQQVAYLMGFKDQATFTRFFKRFVGVTPTEYRNNPRPIK